MTLQVEAVSAEGVSERWGVEGVAVLAVRVANWHALKLVTTMVKKAAHRRRLPTGEQAEAWGVGRGMDHHD
jgi:hypothetical protein